MVKEIRPVTGSIETVDAAAEPTVPSARAEVFYAQALRELAKLDLPFLLAGTYALSAYTGVTRATKDLDIVCKPADYPRVLNHFRNLGYTVAIEDERYDGADIAHLILKQHDQIDWRRLLAYMELHWEVLLAHLLNFRWAYPSERDCVPRWLMDELVARLKTQFELPSPRVKICRGRLFSQVDYEPAVEEWGFVDADEDSE